MKKNKRAYGFALLAALFAALAVVITVRFMHADPIVLSVSENAVEAVDSMMTAICEGDYTGASEYMYGRPNLGVDRPASDEVGAMIWAAFMDSMSYELVGECYPTNDGLAQNVVFRCMELTNITDALGPRAQAMLEKRVAEAEDMTEIYDENEEYREEIVMDILREATRQTLTEDMQYQEYSFALNLKYHQGQWWVVPDQTLLNAISGGVTG